MDPLQDRAEPANAAKEHAYLNSRLPSELQHFVVLFLKDLKRPKYSTPLDYEDLCFIFQEFYRDFETRCREFVCGSVTVRRMEMKDLSVQDAGGEDKDLEKEQLIKEYVEIAEFKVTSSLHDKLLHKSEENNQINEFIKNKVAIVKLIENLDYYELLDIDRNVVDLSLEIYKTISDEFQVLHSYRTPMQKLTKLISIHFELIEVLRNDVNGDNILPMLIFAILINQNNQTNDLFLSFAYIKNFRNASLLKSDELYCLTNLEAALTFIQTVDLKDYKFIHGLTKDQELIISKTHNISPKTPEKYSVYTANVPFNFVTSAIDSSFKNVMNRFKPESPMSSETNLASTTTEYSSNINPLKNFVGDVMKWKSTRSPGSSISLTSDGQTTGRVRSGSGSSFMNKLKSVGHSKQTIVEEKTEDGLGTGEVDPNRFKGKRFEDLTITNLKEMYSDYQILIKNMQIQPEKY